MKAELVYARPFKMLDGSDPDLTLDSQYLVVRAFVECDTTIVSILDDEDNEHQFNIDSGWFDQHFDLIGDLEVEKGDE